MSFPPTIGDALAKELALTPAEEELVSTAGVAAKPWLATRAQTLANIYTVKQLRGMVDDLVATNERLAESTNRNAKALNWLTAIVAAATFVLASTGVAQLLR